MRCDHRNVEPIIVSEHDESTEVKIAAIWCTDCGAIKDKDGRWHLPNLAKERMGAFPHTDDFSKYDAELDEIMPRIPSGRGSREEVGRELAKLVEVHSVGLTEAKKAVVIKFGGKVVSLAQGLDKLIADAAIDEESGHCETCGFVYEDCNCEKDFMGDLMPEVEEIQTRINVHISDNVLLGEMRKLRKKGITIDMAKESLIAKYTKTDHEKEQGGNPCECGAKYLKQGINWWCPSCKGNFIVE